jgi:DNA repair protein RecN (Recombination protein N)
MLRFLRIRRLAVIDSIEVEFDAGLNVLTGETGAGKSILVEAVGLLLGGRASGELVRTGEDQATVEAIFERPSRVSSAAHATELLVRREVTAQGRSRAFIDGELTSAGALRDLASQLIELHGQHEHQTLRHPETHLDILDGFGGLDAAARSVAMAFQEWHVSSDALAAEKRAAADWHTRQELVAFQLGELERASLKEGEDEELYSTRQVLANAERIERLCEESYSALYDRDDAVLGALTNIWRRVAELAAIDPAFVPYLQARDDIKAQLEELARFLRRYADTIEASPARLQQVEDRLALLERLKRKYGPQLSMVIAKRGQLRAETEKGGSDAERLAELERQAAGARARYLAAADDLSRARRSASAAFARDIEQVLADLAMDRTRFEVRFERLDQEESWTARGIDHAEFFVSPNPGEDLRPLARIVSGGELSRIMLGLKTLAATVRHGFTPEVNRPPSASTPGLIFDEVDAGIGGRTADVVGEKLRVLGSAFQVLCITHLPQIAAFADTHFRIEKHVERGRTKTTVTRLDEAGRIDELSRMLGGAAVTAGIRASAKEMLDRRNTTGGAKGEMKPKGESESRRRAQP